MFQRKRKTEEQIRIDSIAMRAAHNVNVTDALTSLRRKQRVQPDRECKAYRDGLRCAELQLGTFYEIECEASRVLRSADIVHFMRGLQEGSASAVTRCDAGWSRDDSVSITEFFNSIRNH